jgi:hypothetical protein
MRRFCVIGFNSLELHGLHRRGLPLYLFFEPFEHFPLLNENSIELFDLMLQMGQMRLEFFDALGVVVCHGRILPVCAGRVEAARDLALRRERICGKLKAPLNVT